MSATNKKSCFLLQFFDCNSIQEKRRYNKRKYEKGEKNFMKNKLRKTNSGITLIALVITIIVLLILAGVTIATLTGDNGILTKATEAKDKTEEGEEAEKVKLSATGALAKDNGGEIKEQYLDEELASQFGEKGTDYNLEGSGPFTVTILESGRKYIVNKEGSIEIYVPIDGNYYDKETEITVGGKPVTIPAGAQVSGIEGEYESVDNGLVIYFPNSEEEKITDWSNAEEIQKTYDQFVWVPVENAILDLTGNSTALADDASIKAEVQKEIKAGRYPMTIKKDENTYIGVLYQFSEENIGENQKKVKVEPLSDWKPTSTNSGKREPDVVTDYDNDETNLTQINGVLGTGYKNATEFKNDLQADFKNMVTRVEENKGFWVGRYETSKMNANQISVIKGTQNGINNVNWYNMYAKQKKYSSQKTLGTMQSTMIWGSQWDQIMIWMKGIENTVNSTNGQYYVINSLGMGNYGTSDDTQSGLANTGFFKVKNVFDLAGNVYSWTLEVNFASYRVIRRRQF